MAVFKGGLAPLAAGDLEGIEAAIAAHQALLQPASTTHGDSFVLNWVSKTLSMFEFGLPLDPVQKAYRLDTWLDEVGRYPAWAMERVTAYLRARVLLPALAEVLADLDTAKSATERRLGALLRMKAMVVV